MVACNGEKKEIEEQKEVKVVEEKNIEAKEEKNLEIKNIFNNKISKNLPVCNKKYLTLVSRFYGFPDLGKLEKPCHLWINYYYKEKH